MVYSLEQRIFLVLEYHRLDKSVTATRRSFQAKFNTSIVPHPNTIRQLYDKFIRTGCVTDDLVANVGRQKSAVTAANVSVIKNVITQDSKKSVRKIAAACSVSRTATHQILRKCLEMYPYKIQTQQPLPVLMKQERLIFANEMLNLIDGGIIDVNRIWFSDEAYFHLDGFVNKQNWRIWGTENPHVCVPRSVYSKKITVWAALSSRGIIGPIYLEETVNSSRYIEILQQFVAVLNTLGDLKTDWFMQDGARPHRTSDVFTFLEEYFENRVIALHYRKATSKGMDWPPCSPDLNPCDYFLWGHLKDAVHQQNPTTISELQQIISLECERISELTLQNVCSNFVLRLRHLIVSNGGHFENIVM